MEPRTASESRAVLVRWMNLTDANSAGFVHGGAVMHLCDEAAGIPPLLTSEPDEIRREREAQTRRRNRLAERDEIRRARDSQPV